jgi:hypothetical protein
MEMRDHSDESMSDTNDHLTDPGVRQALERTDHAALVGRSDAADQRTELYARLRNIIDNAAESIRALKQENATLAAENGEMSDRIGTLQQQIRAITTDLASDEQALRQSAEALEQVMKSLPSAAPTQPPMTRPTPIYASAPETVAAEPPAPSPFVDTVPMTPEADMAAADVPVAETAEAETAEMQEPEMEAPEAAMPDGETPVAEMPQEQPATDESHAAADAEQIPEVPTSYADQTEAAPSATEPPAVRADGSYSLIAYPFVRFSDLGQFQAALQKLAGVHDVQVRRFAQGTLEMRIGYTGTTDLATTLRTLAADVEDVTEEEPYRLRVRLRTSQDG